MPTLLKDLRVNEVSSVDRGAGEGVRIVMMKRKINPSLIEPDNVSKGDPDMTDEDKKAAETKAKSDKETAEKAEKALRDELDVAKREIAVLKMSQKHKDFMSASNMSDDAKDKFTAMEPADRDAHMEKNPIEKRLPESVQKALDEAAADRIILKQLREKDEIATFAKKASDLGLEAVHGEILRKARGGDEAAWGDLEKMIKGLTAVRASSGLFNEIGKRGGAVGDGTAKGDLLAKAEEYKKAQVAVNKKCTDAQAFVKVYTDPANIALKKSYDDEEARARAQRAA